jgi:cell division protein FtsB
MPCTSRELPLDPEVMAGFTGKVKTDPENRTAAEAAFRDFEVYRETMSDLKIQSGKKSASISRRVLDWAVRVWRPAGTAVAIGLALFLTWHVVNGKNGLTVWQKKRVEDHQLRREIDDLEKENARLRERVQRLESDPDAIEHEAREKLHYAKPGEVIYDLPASSQSQGQTQGSGK